MPPPHRSLPLLLSVFLLLHYRPHVASALSAPASSLVGTSWKLRLDVGLQPGTWMPKRFPGWGESGARLPLEVEVEFTSSPSRQRESLVGPRDSTSVIKVRGDGISTYVTERGQESVAFASGGWSVQRPTADIRNAEGSAVRPEGVLRFWIDCPTGARKGDAEVFPGTRIFFTTGVWDDPAGLEVTRKEYEGVVDELQRVVDETRDIREENDRGSGGGGKNVLERVLDFRALVDNSRDFDRLQARKEEMERAAPPRGAAVAANGVRVAPTGSLVIKGNKIPDWLPASEYLILGTFSTKALD